VEQCKANNEQKLKEGVYQNIFNTEFNLSFHNCEKTHV